MDISLFLAQVFGIYFVVMGLALVLRGEAIQQTIGEFVSNRALKFFAGIFVLILGILLILTHNIWDGTWRVLITIFAWLTFLKGIFYLLLPVGFFAGLAKVMNRKSWFMGGGLIAILIGAYLLFIGFGL